MARPLKEGIDWMRYSVNIFAEPKMGKLRRLSRGRGKGANFAECFAVMTAVLCRIYANKGYYAECNEDFMCDVAEDLALDYNEVEAAIKHLIGAGVFDKNLFENEAILSSILCQKEYINATSRRVGDFVPHEKINLLSQNDVTNLIANGYENSENNLEKVSARRNEVIVDNMSTETELLQAECQQKGGLLQAECQQKGGLLQTSAHRVEKSRVEKSRVYISARVHAREETDREKEIFEIALLFFCKGFTSPLAEAQKFYDHFEALGWKNGSGQPIVKKMSKANAWVPASEKRVFSDGQASFMTTLRSTLKKDGLDHQLLWHVRGVKMEDGVVTMFTTAEVMNYFEQNIVTMKKVLQKFGASKLIYSLVEAALRKEA